jgi:outer membrane protein OmpA-like peptidoglycan-associated protein
MAAAERNAATLSKKAAAEMLQQITEQLNEALGGESELVGELSVAPSGDEILISLTDAFDISMFEVGSAVPSPILVVALEKIGGVLSEQPGGVRIHGHTDARPFRSKNYDNWRLSAARAQSAYYMLLRGGLEETRVREITGFADRKLLDEEEPDLTPQPPHRGSRRGSERMIAPRSVLLFSTTGIALLSLAAGVSAAGLKASLTSWFGRCSGFRTRSPTATNRRSACSSN